MLEDINEEIKLNIDNIDTDLISDGWHTFGELYRHRSVLFIKLAKVMAMNKKYFVYKARKHSDGTIMDGCFNLGVRLPDETYIAYHLFNEDWETCDFAQELETSPIKGRYTSNDALDNLKKI